MRNLEFESKELAIVNSLVEAYDYTKHEAVMVVNGYKSVMERIGFFENPIIWAEKIDEAMKRHITPDMWLNIL